VASKTKITLPPDGAASNRGDAVNPSQPLQNLLALRDLIATLRDEGGCPWDRKQTPESVTPYLLEEAYELTSAIDSGDIAAIAEELGDVLFQVLFMVHLFEERGALSLAGVAAQTRTKMIRRHPHVFGNETITTAGDVKLRWAELKAAEKKINGQTADKTDLPAKLPAILKACRYFDRLPDKPHPKKTLARASQALNKLETTMPAEAVSAPEDNEAVQAAADALLYLVHTIVRMQQHPEMLLNRALQRLMRASSDR
jgi:tetrapyrrole methylase family protein / MazG family protein